MNGDRIVEILEKPRLRELKPLYVQVREYKETRRWIFGLVSRRIQGVRDRYRKRTHLRRIISFASLFEGGDSRLCT